jgi:predicted transcriptional regulator
MIISRSRFEAEYNRGKYDGMIFAGNEISKLTQKVENISKTKTELEEKVIKLSSQIREQSKSDMIAKALEVIVKGLKLNTTAETISPLFNAMQQQQQIMMQQSACLPSYSIFGGILR